MTRSAFSTLRSTTQRRPSLGCVVAYVQFAFEKMERLSSRNAAVTGRILDLDRVWLNPDQSKPSGWYGQEPIPT